jgi:hypothetical protein
MRVGELPGLAGRPKSPGDRDVWDQDLEAQITRLEREGTAAEQRAAAQVSAGARQRLRSLDGQVGRPVTS